MIVVADSSPLNYLVLLGYDSLLKPLYDRVLVPAAVLREMQDPRGPSVVISWASRPPESVEVCHMLGRPDPALAGLGAGEREAIQLAQERGADMLLMDEFRGRAEARRRGLETTGTLGILIEGGRRGLVDAERAILRLIAESNFRIDPELRDAQLERARNLKRRES